MERALLNSSAVTVETRDGQGGPRLLWPVSPKIDESLIGLVSRTAADNVHGTLNATLEASGAPHHNSFNLAMIPDIDRAALAYVIRQPVHEIERRCHPLIQRRDGPPVVDFFGATVPSYDLHFRRRLISPSALIRSVHHRALAQHGLVPFCHETGEYLIDACPKCARKLTWYRSRGIERCDDPTCNFDLRQAPCHHIDPALLCAIAPLVRLLDPNPEIHANAVFSLPTPLRSTNRGAVFELAWRLGCIGRFGKVQDRDEHPWLPPEEIVTTLHAGASALRSWPSCLDEAIEANVSDASYQRALSLAAEHRRLGWSGRGWPEHRQLIAEMPPMYGVLEVD
jgi:hypothetical protein